VEITHDDIRRFRELWRDEFGEELSAEDARHHIARLDQLFLMLARRTKPPGGPKSVGSEIARHQ
jgi:hypothetical protein